MKRHWPQPLKTILIIVKYLALFILFWCAVDKFLLRSRKGIIKNTTLGLMIGSPEDAPY
jgi:hypothetical protein